ncbi:MAG: S8 family serine peptidase [Nitrospirae bacterium]|nr:S8 family serine peptidase [Nitrospirota bacterium]
MKQYKIISFLLPLITFFLMTHLSVTAIHAQAPLPGDFIVTFSDETSVVDREAAVRQAGAVMRFNYHIVSGTAVHIPNEKALAALQRDPRVAAIIPDRKVHAHVVSATGNIRGGQTTSGQIIPAGVNRIGASPGSGAGTGKGIGVAVVDTGIDFNHNDLQPNKEYCFTTFSSCQDDNGHGTHVTGIITAINNTIDVVGVAPDAIPYAVKVLDQTGSGSDATVIGGLDWIYQSANYLTPPIRVVNMSLGREGTLDDDPALRQAIQNIVNLGIPVVVSAGNDPGKEVSQQVPGTYPEVMAIASTTAGDGSNKCKFYNGYIKADTASYFTTDGKFDSVSKIGVTVSAPGETKEDISGGCFARTVGILSTKLGGGTTRMSGTSMSAPHVSGVAARILELNSQLLSEDIRTNIRATASRITVAPLDSPTSGYTFDGEREGIAAAP